MRGRAFIIAAVAPVFLLSALHAAAVAAGEKRADALEIVNASYGKGNKTIDVKKQLSERIEDNRLTVTASDELAGSPYHGPGKALRITYRYKGRIGYVVVKEGRTATLPPDSAPGASRRSPFALGVEIKGPIMSEALWKSVRAGRIEAARRKARAVVFEIDTPGGRLDIAERVAIEIGKVHDMPTVAWLRGQGAISAGVMIALACDKIVMSPGASLGASTPYKFQDGLPTVLEEKRLSALRSSYGAAAERKGRPGALAEATVDPSLEVWEVRRGNRRVYVKKRMATDADAANRVRVICAEGKLLTVSAENAVKLGLADAVADADSLASALIETADLGPGIAGPAQLSYRKSMQAPRVLKEEYAKEAKARKAAASRREARERTWREEYEKLQRARASIRALDPRAFTYVVKRTGRRFEDGGKLWRRRSEKCIGEVGKCLGSLDKLIRIAEKEKRPDDDETLAKMRAYRQDLRTFKRQLEEQKDLKYLPY